MRCSSTFSLFLVSSFLLATAVIGTDENVKRQVITIDPVNIPDSSSTSPSSPPSSSATPTSPSSSSTPTSTTEPSTTTTDASTTASSGRDTSKASSTAPSPTRTATSRPTSSASPRVITNTITISGSVTEQISTSIPTEAPSVTPTNTPNLDSETPSGSSGLSTAHKNIIIGVVVGVGGAIIIGGLAVVAWRLRRRRNSRGPGDEDDLMNSGTAVGSSSHETSTVGTANNPFKTTLDQYHSPGPVNQASNF